MSLPKGKKNKEILWDRWRDDLLINSLNEGVIVIDSELTIRVYNKAAETLTGQTAAQRIGEKAEVYSLEDSPAFEVLRSGQPIYNIENDLKDGRTFLVNYIPIKHNGETIGIVQSFNDVTERKSLERALIHTRDELDEAFALTLPNSKVEYKLKSTPEFRDVYDPRTGLITITEVIPDGNYRHVVNALKVAADLNHKGIMGLVGVKKDILVETLIFHDIGKAQPDLKVGDKVDPLELFEPGMEHAWRSADIAEHYYNLPEDAVTLIRYHHHSEDELPPSFPSYLLPMHRLIRVIDGLSASLTRRKSKLMLEAKSPTVFIWEENEHPSYAGQWAINLFTGLQRHYTLEDETLDKYFKGKEIRRISNGYDAKRQ